MQKSSLLAAQQKFHTTKTSMYTVYAIIKIQCIVGTSLSNTKHIDFATILPHAPSDTYVVQNQQK